MVIETILFTSLSVMPQIIHKMSTSTITNQNVLAAKIELSPTPKPTNKTKAKASKKPVLTKSLQSPINKDEILKALNAYRRANNKNELVFDQKLQEYAQKRADELKNKGKLDNHAPFNQYMKSKKAFLELNFNNLSENQSWNYKGDENGLISQFYAKSPGHNKNQLSGQYSHVGIGVSGVFTNIVFGGNRQ